MKTLQYMYVLCSKRLIVLKQREEMMNDNVDACFNEIEYVIDNMFKKMQTTYYQICKEIPNENIVDIINCNDSRIFYI